MSHTEKNFRILVVDDFEMGRQIMKSALHDLGFSNIEEAEDGKQAVDVLNDAAAKNNPFAMVFCDWNMPELNGLQVLQIVRKDAVYSKIPFVMVTAESDQESIVMALSSGATDYIVKPITHEVLKIKIERMVGKMQAAPAKSA